MVAPPDGERVIGAQEFADVSGLRGVDVTMYVETGDVEVALRKVESLGGSRVLGPVDILDGRRLALFSDPEGQLIGLVEPRTERTSS